MKLSEIYTYCNESLLDDSLNSLGDILGHLNTAQDIIATICPVEAPEVLLTPALGILTLPEDFLTLESLTYDGFDVETAQKPWKGTLRVSKAWDGLALTLRYHKQPAPLANDNDQVPEIDPRFHPDLALFAAKMFYLKEDETNLKEQFRREFVESVMAKVVSPGTVSRFSNYF